MDLAKERLHQLRNTICGVRKLVTAADVQTVAWDGGGQPTPETPAEFQRRKKRSPGRTAIPT